MFEGLLPEALWRSCRPGEYFNLEARLSTQFVIVVGGNRGRRLNLRRGNALPVTPVKKRASRGRRSSLGLLAPPFCKSEL
jgi:hypothetical protein